MQEKKCLKCEKIYQPKKTTSKFCSDSCRVMWNRGKEKKQKDVSQQVLINTILEKLSKVNFVPVPEGGYDGKRFVGNSDEAPKYNIPKEQVEQDAEPISFQKLLNGMSKAVFSDEKEDYAVLIHQATHLSEKQRNLLLTSLWANK